MPTENSLDITEYSEEVQEIIGEVPHWLVRWGISLFFGVLFVILLMSSLIKSPDIVPANLVISSENQPQEVVARKQGKLMQLFVSEDSEVDSGQILGFMESIGQPEDVLRLSAVVDDLQIALLNSNYGVIDNLPLKTTIRYGELQPAFQEFYLALLQFKAYKPGGSYSRKTHLINSELQNLEQLGRQLRQQKNLSEADYAIQQREFEAFKKLAEAKVISPLEFSREASKFLNKRMPVENSESALISNNAAKRQKERELLETESIIAEQRAAFLSKIQRFKSEIDRWKFENILMSDRPGKVIFHRLLKQQEWLEADKPVMYIANERSGNQFGELTLGQYSLGKIRIGQEVLIKLEAYPYHEFGLLRGKITYMSNVLYGDTTFTAKVKLPEGLISSYNKPLKLQTGLVAKAEIITGNRSLLSRVFNSLTVAIN